MKRIIFAIFGSFIMGPGRVVLRFFFYKVAVRIYSIYLSAMRKLGWSGTRLNRLTSIFDQKFVHVIVIVITATLIFTNITTDTKAQSISEASGKTILSSLIQSEFQAQDSGQIVEQTFDQESTISPTQQSYLDNLSSVKTQPSAEMNPTAQDGQDLMIGDQAPDGTALVTPGENTTNRTKQDRHEIITYTVLPGDTISTIAQQFDIGVNTILWANNLNAYSVIRPGDNLKILPVSGVVYDVASGDSLKSVAAKYGVEATLIAAQNGLSQDGGLQAGDQLIIPGGKKDFVETKPKTYSGLALLKDLVSSDKQTDNSNTADSSDSTDNSAPADVPDQSPVSSGNMMHWPTTGYRITQYFSWRHFAIDIADHVGTPIFAADAGVIQTAGWGTGYGNQILINHGGGKQTRYAHMSKFLVKVGDVVSKGQTIGLMGSTGWSTGPHVHFEVIIDGVKYNPLNYVK